MSYLQLLPKEIVVQLQKGALRTGANSGLRTRYDYDPWGRRVNVNGGNFEADFGFTGHYYHAPSGLHLTLYRAYSAELGRWLSRDPLENAELLPEGPNIYGYVADNPINSFDPSGRQLTEIEIGFILLIGITVIVTIKGFLHGRHCARLVEKYRRAMDDCLNKGVDQCQASGEIPDWPNIYKECEKKNRPPERSIVEQCGAYITSSY